MYHFVTELKEYRGKPEAITFDDAKLKYLNLLIEYISTAYASTASRLASYVKTHEITYNLLWALFKPNTIVFTTILEAQKPACYNFESGKENITSHGVSYFHVGLRFLDFNGQLFGEISMALGISKFNGAKRIDQLEAFPLEFHRSQERMGEHLVRCGRRLVSLMGKHYMQYRGNAYYIENRKFSEVPVDSRIMVDVSYFRKANPNYTRPHINELARPSSSTGYAFIALFDDESDNIKSNGIDTNNMSDEELMVCSQTVYGWSFDNKMWRKCSSLQHCSS